MNDIVTRPFLFEDLSWLDVGMTTRLAAQPEEDRLDLAASISTMEGIESAITIVGQQVHKDTIKVIGYENSDIENMQPGQLIEIPETDALITTEPDTIIGVFTADCVPVVIVDTESRMLATIHAGREGTLKRIVPKTFERMLELGAEAENMLAWIAPSISANHYEVSEEMAGDFRDHFGHYPGVIQGPELRHLALGLINWCELIACGMKMEHIELDARCTFERDDLFYSFRRDEANTGRMCTFAVRIA